MKKLRFLTSSMTLTLLVVMFFIQKLFGQADTTQFILIPNNQIKFTLAPVIYNNLNFQHKGKKVLKSLNTFSGVIGMGYDNRIGNTWGVNLDAEMSVIPRNLLIPYDIIFDSTTNTAQLGRKFLWLNDFFYQHFIYIFSVSLEKLFIKDHKTFYSIQAGAKLNRLVAHPYEESVGMILEDTTRFFDYYMENYYQRNFFSYFLKFGLIKVNQAKKIYIQNELKRSSRGGNTMQVNLVINYSPYKIGKGWYRFYNLPFESYGTVNLGLNYLGLEFSYGLTLTERPYKKKTAE
ncbi:MAG: hypothetical protein HY738_10810 [Bacteroidia bacterium]|nr:hypothetical protein [Bacteroidia bacterium]